MRRKPFVFYLILVFCIFCGVILYSCFAPPANTPCTPLGHPDGKKLYIESTKIYTFQTNAPYSDVVDFYRTHNPPREDKDNKIDVKEYDIHDRGILFVCFHVLGGFLGDEVEIGCVFVRDEKGQGVVDVAWSYGATTTAGCDYMLPDIAP